MITLRTIAIRTVLATACVVVVTVATSGQDMTFAMVRNFTPHHVMRQAANDLLPSAVTNAAAAEAAFWNQRLNTIHDGICDDNGLCVIPIKVRDDVQHAASVRDDVQHAASVRDDVQHAASVRDDVQHAASVRDDVQHAAGVVQLRFDR